MPGARLELARLCGAVDFESTASANSAIPASGEERNLTGNRGSLASPVRTVSTVLSVPWSHLPPLSSAYVWLLMTL